MKRTKLVIVFPIYNGEKTMLKSLKCVAEQEFRDFKGIILENKSTDKTLKIAQEFCANDDRFEIIQNEEHLSAIDNFINAIQIGREHGEYFCLRACDDLSTPDYFSKLVAALDANPQKLLAAASTLTIDPDGPDFHKVPDPAVLTFWKQVSSGKIPKRLTFPSEWFYGVYRSDSEAADILCTRLPQLGSAWCAASYTVAEFVIRDFATWVEGPEFIFYRGSNSKDLYASKSISTMLRQRIRYTVGCYRVLDKLPPLSARTRRLLFKCFWRDARSKTNYRIRRHLKTRVLSAFS
ncbi:glycosyltransferase family 2 protein [Breoghania sp.]|uniref:glycosyltransferase family 2 protein n=1 Tax=Breoghania sp. TaxID=2065378 RepID=UPI0029CA0DA3|nr:glycosyltransferase family 2 protein [Breoghania sp.]